MQVDFLVEGKEAFPYIIKAIDEASKEIWINMFIWRYDKIGIEMAQAVLKAADRGVSVTIVKDRLGGIFELAEESRQSFFHQQMNVIEKIKALIIDKAYPMAGKGNRKQGHNTYLSAMTSHPNITLKVDKRLNDHSKFYMIDGHLLIMGGINIEDKELDQDVEGKYYHDYMIGIDDEEILRRFKERMFGSLAYDSNQKIDFIFNRYVKGRLHLGVKKPIITYIESANRRIDMVMAYLGDKDIIKAIISKVNSGLDIHLMVPKRANLQQDINMRIIRDLLIQTDHKIHIYLSKKMVHGKLMMIDHQLVTFGSTNFNRQAMKHLGELNIVIKDDKEIIKGLKHVLNTEYNKSIKIKSASDIKFNKIRAFLESFMC